VRLRLRELCTSAERLAWAKANGCPWGVQDWVPVAVVVGRDHRLCNAAAGGHLKAMHDAVGAGARLHVGRRDMCTRRRGIWGPPSHLREPTYIYQRRCIIFLG
jgi:hypothetical protein